MGRGLHAQTVEPVGELRADGVLGPEEDLAEIHQQLGSVGIAGLHEPVDGRLGQVVAEVVALRETGRGRGTAKPLAQAWKSYPRVVLLRLILWRLMLGGLLWRRIESGRLRCRTLKLADCLAEGATDLWKLVPSEEEQR